MQFVCLVLPALARDTLQHRWAVETCAIKFLLAYLKCSSVICHCAAWSPACLVGAEIFHFNIEATLQAQFVMACGHRNGMSNCFPRVASCQFSYFWIDTWQLAVQVNVNLQNDNKPLKIFSRICWPQEHLAEARF